MREKPTTVLGWRCPWSGDDNDTQPWTYRIWVRAHWADMRLRHRLGLHQWRKRPLGGENCNWCGARRDLLLVVDTEDRVFAYPRADFTGDDALRSYRTTQTAAREATGSPRSDAQAERAHGDGTAAQGSSQGDSGGKR